MKNKISVLLAIAAFALIITSCKKSSNSPDDNSNSSSNSTSTSTIIESGSWHVTYYHENSNDHTSNFSGYTFTFNANGTMSATVSGVTTSGTWSNDDSHNEFHMNIGTSSPLNDISNGWLIITKTATEFDLKDDNTAHNEELHFTKI